MSKQSGNQEHHASDLWMCNGSRTIRCQENWALRTIGCQKNWGPENLTPENSTSRKFGTKQFGARTIRCGTICHQLNFVLWIYVHLEPILRKQPFNLVMQQSKHPSSGAHCNLYTLQMTATTTEQQNGTRTVVLENIRFVFQEIDWYPEHNQLRTLNTGFEHKPHTLWVQIIIVG